MPEVVSQARERLIATLDGALGDARRVALIGGALHANAGDHAILLGTLGYLRDREIEVACFDVDERSYDANRLHRRIGPGDPLLLRGGGSINDIWPGHQDFRERVIAEHADRPVIQLPQSIYFRDSARAERAGTAMSAHPRLSLLVRDRASLERAAKLGLEARLCPDTAMYLSGGWPRRSCEVDVLILGRTDLEAAADWSEVDDEVPRFDWTRSRAPGLLGVRAAARAMAQSVARPLDRRVLRLHERASAKWLAANMRLLARARVVVTDRIHGHILCLLAGIPHVIIDNVDRKVTAYHETWTSGSRLTSVAASAHEAVELAREMARSQRHEE